MSHFFSHIGLFAIETKLE